MVRKTTTRNQFEKLVSLMLTKPNIALGSYNIPKEESIVFWRILSKTLNKMGPPVKDITTWKKVWIDYKGYIKTRLRRNSEAIASDGIKKYHFNDVEEKVIELLNLRGSKSQSIGDGDQSMTTDNFIEFRDIDSSRISIASNSSLDINRKKKPKHTDPHKLSDPDASIDIKYEDLEMSVDSMGDINSDMYALVKTQTDIQKKFCDGILNFMSDQKKQNKKTCAQYEELNANLINIQTTLDRLSDIQESRTAEMKRHNIAIEKMKYKKLELKKHKSK